MAFATSCAVTNAFVVGTVTLPNVVLLAIESTVKGMVFGLKVNVLSLAVTVNKLTLSLFTVKR